MLQVDARPRARTSLALVAICLTLLAATAPADACGPVILAGHDAEEHGFHAVYAGLFDSLFDNVTNGKRGILAIGPDSGSGPAVWILGVASRMTDPQAVTFARDALISTVDFEQYAIVFIATAEGEVTGGLSLGENNLLAARSTEIAAFINNGGGLFGMTQANLPNAWAYIAEAAPVVHRDFSYQNIEPTMEGASLGITSTNLDGCCFHNFFESFPPFLRTLATIVQPGGPFDGDAAFIGGNETCIVPFCGDGNLDPGEECDDGNTIPGDGCSADCRIELEPLIVDAGPARRICPGDPVGIGGAPTAMGGQSPYLFLWTPPTDLDDATIANPTASPMVTTDYMVTVTDSTMQVEADSTRVVVVAPPIAGLEHPLQHCFGCAPVTFTDRSIGDIVSWLWDLGDGTMTGEVNPSHVYDQPGIYNIRLDIVDACGQSDSQVSQIEIVSLPTPDFAATSPHCFGAATTFSNLSSADAVSFVWDFGDSSPTVTDFEPLHDYAAPGTYTVSLTAANACGMATPVTRTVRVIEAPVADFASNAPRCSGPVQFTDSTAGDPTGWQWDFGDGSPPTSTQDPSHVYGTPGTYSVTLTASNACGTSAPHVEQVTVDPDLDAGFNRWSDCQAPRGPMHSRPGTTDIADTARTVWELDDSAFCRMPGQECSFAMYVVADCGTSLKIPLDDVESGSLKIFDLFAGRYVTLTASSTGGWSAGPAELIQWEDCAGTDPLWDDEVTTIEFTGSPSVCGVFRLEFPEQHAGFWWDLFTNCDGSATPGFTIYDNVCDAIDAYAPLPELAIDDVTVEGACPDYTVGFEIVNTGCIAVDAPVNLSSSQGGSLDVVVPGVEPGPARRVEVDFTVAGCSDGTITVTLDLMDVVGECSELVDAAVSCNVDAGAGHVATVDPPPACVDPPVFCGAFAAEDLDLCADTGVRVTWPEVVDPGSGGGSVTYDVYRDDVRIASGLSVTEYLDLSGVNDQVYRYRVQAVNACGLTDLSFGEVQAADEVGGPIPPDLGNVLRAIRAATDVRLSWSTSLRTFEYEIRYDLDPWFPAPASVAVIADPERFVHDPDAVPSAAGWLIFYQLRGINCTGQTGP